MAFLALQSVVTEADISALELERRYLYGDLRPLSNKKVYDYPYDYEILLSWMRYCAITLDKENSKNYSAIYH